MVTPTMFPWDKKWWSTQKSLSQKCITFLVSHKLSHDLVRVFLGGVLTGPYPMLRFGGACGLGAGVLSSCGVVKSLPEAALKRHETDPLLR